MKVVELSSGMRKAAMLLTFLLASGSASADSWVGGGGVQIASLEPLLTYGGGMIRVMLSSPMSVPVCGDSSGQVPLVELLYTSGTQEARTAVVAGLYTALAQGRPVTFLLSSAACSPDGMPVIVGMHVGS